MWALSDESLLAGLASGEPDSAAAFVRRFQGRVFGLAQAIVGDPALAEEVAQETFVRAWRHAGAYDARRGRVSTWLLAIARNVAISSLRMRRPEPKEPQEIMTMQALITEPGPDARTPAVDETERLRDALAALPEQQKRALVLAAFYGKTSREIAEIEDAPIGTIKTRIRTAMLRLRSSLGARD
jgi:RNA polymerase sigma factor (sigma-70 family)